MGARAHLLGSGERARCVHFLPAASRSLDYTSCIGHELFRFSAESRWDEFLLDYFGLLGLPPEASVDPGLPPTLALSNTVYLPLLLKGG